MNKHYAIHKLTILIRDLKKPLCGYTDEEFARQMGRIVEGATGYESPYESIKDRMEEDEHSE